MAIEGRKLEDRQSKANIVQYYKYPAKITRIKPKILIRHKKMIEQILGSKEDDRIKINKKTSDIQLKLFSESLN